MGNQQGPPVEHMALSSVLSGSLDGRGVWGGVDACQCMTKPLCCPPETVITLSVAMPQYKI